MKTKGFEPVLKNTRWLLLKRPENLTETQGTEPMKKVAHMLPQHRPLLMNWFRAQAASNPSN